MCESGNVGRVKRQRGGKTKRQPSGARRVASATNRPTDQETRGWEGANVGMWEGLKDEETKETER